MAKKENTAVIPEMDYPEHERTYENFVALFKWGTIAMVILLILMALFLL